MNSDTIGGIHLGIVQYYFLAVSVLSYVSKSLQIFEITIEITLFSFLTANYCYIPCTKSRKLTLLYQRKDVSNIDKISDLTLSYSFQFFEKNSSQFQNQGQGKRIGRVSTKFYE